MVSRVLRRGAQVVRPLERFVISGLQDDHDRLYREVERIVARYEPQIEALLESGPISERELPRLPWWQAMEREIDRATARFVDGADRRIDAGGRSARATGRDIGRQLVDIASEPR